jgi:hypothetical protein
VNAHSFPKKDSKTTEEALPTTAWAEENSMGWVWWCGVGSAAYRKKQFLDRLSINTANSFTEDVRNLTYFCLPHVN